MQKILEEILIKAAAGDMEAFENIYKITSCFVYNVALQITNNKEETEELTRKVFLKIHKNLKKFRFASSFRTWIYRMAVNAAINTSKKRSRESSRKPGYEEGFLYDSLTESLKQRLDKKKNENLVRLLLDSLRPVERACLVLRDMQGLSYKEISDTLGIDINTVRSRLGRTREALLKTVKKEVI